MDAGEFLTRVTVWLALTLYVAGEWAGVRQPDRKSMTTAWWLNAAGCACFLAHVAGAFHAFHGWSHAAAYADTARQTKDFSGWDSGAGLYLNYLFALVWMTEVAWSGWKPAGYAVRSRWLRWAVRGFFLFLIFNGAFVFVRGPQRWFGLLLCVLLAGCWWRRAKPGIDARQPAKSS